jgi:transposase
VAGVTLDDARSTIEVRVAPSGEGALGCPTCRQSCPGYDRRPRRWRNLDTYQYPTILICDVPRIECLEHGVLQVQVPWADEGSRITALC